MTEINNRRGQYRRYSDRRVAALLKIHEILFYEADNPSLDLLILNAVRDDFATDRAALVKIVEKGNIAKIESLCSNWKTASEGTLLKNSGIKIIADSHIHSNAVLTLSKFRKVSLLTGEQWTLFWEKGLMEQTSALLSVPVISDKKNILLLWLALDKTSREWNSHDRNLAEEIAHLLFMAIEKKVLFKKVKT